MEKIGKIKRVICPYCKKEMYRNMKTQRISYARYIKSYDWRCVDCAYFFDETWFDTFDTYEHLVLREGENTIQWKKNMVKGGEFSGEGIKLRLW